MNYAVLFPGQGSQAVGMLSDHVAPEIAATFNEASSVLGWDVLKLVQAGPAEELNKTERTQPALLAASIALWRLWLSKGKPAPTALAGHSLGEYSALVAAGVLEFTETLKIVELRGQLMQAAVPPGAGGMAAVIGLDDDKVEALCKIYPGSEVLEPVNYNAPGQVVVAGQTAALEWLAANGKANGARMIMKLPVSVPSHCSLMRQAAEKLAERLAQAKFHQAVIPVLHNLDAQPRTEPDGVRQALKEQLYRPVRWTQTIQNLHSQGITRFVECGPGKVLCGLGKRILSDARNLPLEDSASLQNALDSIA